MSKPIPEKLPEPTGKFVVGHVRGTDRYTVCWEDHNVICCELGPPKTPTPTTTTSPTPTARTAGGL